MTSFTPFSSVSAVTFAELRLPLQLLLESEVEKKEPNF